MMRVGPARDESLMRLGWARTAVSLEEFHPDRGSNMRRRPTPLATGLLLMACAPAAAAPVGDDVFVPTKVWEFHLTVPAKEFAAMEPAGGGFPGFGQFGGPRKDPPKPDGPTREVHKG